MKLMDMPQKEVVELFLWVLQYLAAAQKPNQQMLEGLNDPSGNIRCTTFGRIAAERFAPAGIAVDYDAWLFRHLSKRDRAQMRADQPGIEKRPVFTLGSAAITLAADSHEEA